MTMTAEISDRFDESADMAGLASAPAPADQVRRIEELGKIILAYSDVTDKLQHSHDQLLATVQSLRLELGEKNRQLERRNRLAALGEMAAGMAHEIRNPLGGIQLYASMLSDDVRDRPDCLRLVTKISGGVRRLESLVGQVLQFSREIVAEPVETDLVEILRQSVEMAQPTLSARGIDCALRAPDAFGAVVDPLLLGQAVLNLLLNAAEAMDVAGAVQIELTAPTPGDDARQFHLCVQDQGPGIDPAVIDRVFNPFFTTKDNGTGLGLAIVHRIIEAHEGAIRVVNVPGGGARFEIAV